MQKTTKEASSFRLAPETLDMLRGLSDRWGVSQAQVLEILIREAVREGRQLRAVSSPKTH